MNSQGTGFVISSREGLFILGDAECVKLIDGVVKTPISNRGVTASLITMAGEQLYKCRDSGVVFDAGTTCLKVTVGLEGFVEPKEDTLEIPSGKLIIAPWDLIEDIRDYDDASFFRAVLSLGAPTHAGVCFQSSGSLKLHHGDLKGPVFFSTTLASGAAVVKPVKQTPEVPEPIQPLEAKLHTITFTDVTRAWKCNPYFLDGKATLRVILQKEVPDAVAIQFIRTRVSELLPGTGLEKLLLPDVVDTVLKPKPGCSNVLQGVAGVVNTTESSSDGAILQIEYDTQAITLTNTKEDRSLIGRVYEA